MRKSLILAAWCGRVPAFAADVGLVKVSKGNVQIQRNGAKIAARWARGADSDVISPAPTARRASPSRQQPRVGGPEQRVRDRQVPLRQHHARGRVRGQPASKGRLAAISGKMVKQSPESMKIRTPSAIMGVRGTEFVVQVDEDKKYDLEVSRGIPAGRWLANVLRAPDKAPEFLRSCPRRTATSARSW
jgi:hypothetical protein